MLKTISAAAAVFLLTASAAAAGPMTATLQKPIASPAKKVVSSVVISCAADSCTSVSDVSHMSAKRICRALVKWVGPVTAFSGADGQMSAEQLAECNKG